MIRVATDKRMTSAGTEGSFWAVVELRNEFERIGLGPVAAALHEALRRVGCHSQEAKECRDALERYARMMGW